VENAQMMGILRVTNPHQVACGERDIDQRGVLGDGKQGDY